VLIEVVMKGLGLKLKILDKEFIFENLITFWIRFQKILFEFENFVFGD
jgi:hypothetical protein